MTLSTAQLDAMYTAANMGEAPDAATSLLLAAYAAETVGGSLTDAQALSQALHSTEGVSATPPTPNTPEDSTDVALAVYQFFTGSAPTLGGLAYLVNGGGNPNDLDSAYYASFNQANRYYNFAINLITGNAAASASFAASYGGVTFDQAVTAAYEEIVGTPNVGAAAATAAIAAIEAQLTYFQTVASEIAPTVNQDLATKAIAIAYILEEAVKADVGYYAYAIDQFDTALANGLTPVGETATGDDLLTSYPIVPPGQTFTLTTGVDTITPADVTGNNNVVNGTELTFNSFDSINLGTTTGNVFNWVDSTNYGGFEFATPFGVVVEDVQTANFAAKTALFIDTRGWGGLETLNVDTYQSSSGDLIYADPTVAVNVNNILVHDNFGSGLTVVGGQVDTINEFNGDFYSNSPITVDGGTGTTTVSVTQTFTAGVGFDANVVVNDYYATIANVTIDGLAHNAVWINDEGNGIGLSNLTVNDVAYGAAVFIDDWTGLTLGTLNLSINNDHWLYVDDEYGAYSTLNVTVGDEASKLKPNMGGVTGETITGSSTLFQVAEDMYLLESIAISGAAGLTDWDLAGLGYDYGNLAAVIATTSSGPITVALDDQITSFAGGSGTDFVVVFDDALVAITGGSASNNEIVFNEPGANLIDSYANVSHFEILGTAWHSVGVYNLEGFSSPTQIDSVDVRYNPAGALVFTGAAATQTLTVEGGLTITSPITLVQGAAAAAGSHDVLNLIIGPDTDTSDVGTGFTNYIGTDTSVPHHIGATITTETFVGGTPEVFAHQTVTLTTVLAGGTESVDITSPAGDTVTISNATNNPVTEAAALAAAFNADPTDSAILQASASGDTITFTDKVGGTGNDWSGTFTESAGETHSVGAYTFGADATAATGTITVTATDGVPNQINLSDSAGPLAGYVALTGGESAQAAANAIVTLLQNDLFTGVSDGGGTSTTVSFTYPAPGQSGLTATDTVAQVDTISLAGVSVASGDIFSETFTGNSHTETVTYIATGADTDTTVAAALAGLINADTVPDSTTVVATSSGGNIYLTEATGDATMSFTSSQVSEETFNPSYIPVGSNAITADGYETLNITSQGTSFDTNTTYVVDNALTSLVVTGGGNLNLATLGGHLASIDTSGATGDINLYGVFDSEVTTGITAILGNASVAMEGNAATGFTDVITGLNGSDTIYATDNGGNTDVSLGNGHDFVQLDSGTANSVTLGNGGGVSGYETGDTVWDYSNGADHITLGNGEGDWVYLDGTGNSVVTLGHGADGEVDAFGAGNLTITFGSGAGDYADLTTNDHGVNTGVDAVTFGGPDAYLDLSNVDGPSFLTPTTTSQVDILTNNLDVITGMVHGDTIYLDQADTLLAPALNMAGVTDSAVFTTGTYSATGGTFTYNATGHDALLTYDAGTNDFVSVVLVGGAAEISHATITGSTIHF